MAFSPRVGREMTPGPHKISGAVRGAKFWVFAGLPSDDWATPAVLNLANRESARLGRNSRYSREQVDGQRWLDSTLLAETYASDGAAHMGYRAVWTACLLWVASTAAFGQVTLEQKFTEDSSYTV